MFDSEKKTLDALDDKRHTLSNGCDSLAHGHYQIKNGYIRRYQETPPAPPVQEVAVAMPTTEPMEVDNEYGFWNDTYSGPSADEILEARAKRQKLEDESLKREWGDKFDVNGNFKACSDVLPAPTQRPRNMLMTMEQMRALRGI